MERHRVRFEPTDLSLRPTIITGVAIVAFTIAVALLMHFIYRPLLRERESAGAESQAAAQVLKQLPPEPRLQPSPPLDFEGYRAAQLGQLNHYGWIDRDKSIVGLPIQRAMQLIVERGIPPQTGSSSFVYNPPQAGTRQTGFEGKVEPEPR